VFETFALLDVYQVGEQTETGTPLFSGNLQTWNNSGFAIHTYDRSSETLNITTTVLGTAFAQFEKYGDRKAVFIITLPFTILTRIKFLSQAPRKEEKYC
jgi:hypothetical protein